MSKLKTDTPPAPQVPDGKPPINGSPLPTSGSPATSAVKKTLTADQVLARVRKLMGDVSVGDQGRILDWLQSEQAEKQSAIVGKSEPGPEPYSAGELFPGQES